MRLNNRGIAMKLLFAGIAATMLFALPAQATLNISDKPTKNVDCQDGVCVAIADDANLNTSDLAARLADSDIRVITEGGVAQDMFVLSPLNWSSSHALSLETEDRVVIRSAITVQGTAHLSLAVAGGPIYQKKGAVRFWDMASQLTIDGDDYRLVNSVAGLAAMVAAHPKGHIALANDYDAKQDGQVTRVPVQTDFAGTFDGLGNKITNFAIFDTADMEIALFTALKAKGMIRNLGMTEVNVLAENSFNNIVAGLVAYNAGTIYNCYVDGGTARTDFRGTLGGLVGVNYGVVGRSWANVSVEGAQNAEAGGLIGNAHGHVYDVYATGRVIAGDHLAVGGLIGYSLAHVTTAYATGHVSGGQGTNVGGLLGEAAPKVSDSYWDTETSGTEFGVGGGNAPGVTGMTTAELQAELPAGFDDGAWAQSPKINGGLPYLVSNPPRK
jgi:hypothetical protein